MMDYLFLFCSAVFDSAKGLMSRKLGNESESLSDSVLLNLLRSLICAGIGLCVCLFGGKGFPGLDGKMLWICLLSGVLTAVFMVSWLFAVRVGAFLLLSVICNIANLVPTLLAAVFYGEAILPQHLAGLALFLSAIVLMGRYQRSQGGKLSSKDLAVMILTCAFYGLYCFSFKVFVHAAPSGGNDTFQFYTYLFSTAVLIVLLPIIRCAEGKACRRHKLSRGSLPLVILMSLSLYLCSFTKTLAARSIPAGVLYSMSGALVMILNVIGVRLFFGEKITRDSLLGCALTIAALVVMNLQ